MPLKFRTEDDRVVETGTVALTDDEVRNIDKQDSDSPNLQDDYGTGDGIGISTNLGEIEEVTVTVMSTSGYEVKAGTVITEHDNLDSSEFAVDLVDNTGSDISDATGLTTPVEFSYTVAR